MEELHLKNQNWACFLKINNTFFFEKIIKESWNKLSEKLMNGIKILDQAVL